MFMELTKKQIDKKIQFIEEYIKNNNAASSSVVDANANVSVKNIATMSSEINKDINIQINRQIIYNHIKELFSEELAEQYLADIKAHNIYVHDETSLNPYCASISLYPLLCEGLKSIGGESSAPKNLDSFCGSFINLIFAVSSQFAGAVAAVEFLMYFDYFARKKYGCDDYLAKHKEEIEQYFQQVVYTINQPAAARGFQSVFFNMSVYDRNYFESLFKGFQFPDGGEPCYDTLAVLQEHFLTWFTNERKKAILTFPVVTVAMLVKDGIPVDKEFESMIAQQLADKNSFFVYQSESADSLASCCRLRNEINENTFSHTLGAGGVSTGSINVITINLNRVIQTGVNLPDLVRRVHAYQVAYRKYMEKLLHANMLTAYTAGYIHMDKQYLTLGLNGIVEAAESKGIKASVNDEYKAFVEGILKTVYDLNKEAKKTYGYMFNTEFVPAENLGVKSSEWDKKDGLFSPRDCYNSYFYPVEDESINIADKLILHGKDFVQYLDGGSALHINLDEHLTKEAYVNLLRMSAKAGCNYFCINVRLTICNICEHINKDTVCRCEACGSENVDYATRVIGYLKRVSAWSGARQKEHRLRHYHRA